MIPLIVLASVLSLLLAARYTIFNPPGETDHDRCLRNIERLERELFPDWFAAPGPYLTGPEELEFSPGARWPVETGPYSHLYFRNDLDPKSTLARDMMARGMLYSGEWEAARVWMHKREIEETLLYGNEEDV